MPTPTGKSPPSAQKSIESDSDSARDFLQSLEGDRGTKMLPEADYQEARQGVLQELAHGPRLKTSTLVTLGVVGLILFCFFIIGLAMLFHAGAADWILAVASGTCLVMWAYVFRRYVAGIRQQARMSLRERLAELEELRDEKLITQIEFEHIYGAIHLNRGVPLEPENQTRP